MVFGRKKVQKGKLECTKFFLHCHHKQRQTGKHQKSNRILKTVSKEHGIKHTNCPAKRKDVYNLFSKWRKEHLGIKGGKEMYAELEHIIEQYNTQFAEEGELLSLM